MGRSGFPVKKDRTLWKDRRGQPDRKNRGPSEEIKRQKREAEAQRRAEDDARLLEEADPVELARVLDNLTNGFRRAREIGLPRGTIHRYNGLVEKICTCGHFHPHIPITSFLYGNGEHGFERHTWDECPCKCCFLEGFDEFRTQGRKPLEEE